MGPPNLIIQFTTSTHCETLEFQEFESFQLILSFIGVQINEEKQEIEENKEKNLFLGT